MSPIDPKFFDSEEMHAALAARDIGTVYQLLTRQGVSQRRIAELTGQSQSEVCEILHGRQVVNVRVFERIADGFSISRARLGVSYGEQQAATPTARGEMSEAMKRRALVFSAIGAGTGQVFAGLPELALPAIPVLPARVEMVHVHLVRAVTEHLRGLARHYGGQADLLGAAAGLYTPWMHAPAANAVSAALAAELAELHTETGWCHYDTGLDATTHFTCALHLAGKTRDPYGIANAAWHAGMVLTKTGYPNDGLKLLQLGQLQIRRLANEPRAAVLAGRLARTSAAAYARMRGIDEATRSLAEGNDGWEPRDIFERAGAALGTAMIHRDLGQLDAAERFATAAARTYSQAHRRGRTITQLLLAELHLRAGEPQGLTLAHQAIQAVSTLQSVAVRREWLPPLATALETRTGTDTQQLARTARHLATAPI